MKNFRFGFYLFFFLVFLLSFFVSGSIESQDGFTYLAVARNIYYNHEPTAPIDEYNTVPRINIPLSTYVGKDGKTYATTGLGFSLAFIPSVAITDLIYKHFAVLPLIHFPLDADWLILLTASFTNIFFAAGLGVTLFFYFKELKIKTKTSFFFTLLSLFATNLFPYAKHSMPHMMFTFFLVLSFFLLKKYSSDRRKKLLMFFSGLSYGIVIITYNQTFFLPAIPYILYYLFLTKPKFNKENLVNTLNDLLLFALGALPFFGTSTWFEHVHARGWNLNSLSSLKYEAKQSLLVPPTIFFEGLYGQLLSSGRSIFLYSPLLLIPIIFWAKTKREIRAETIVFTSLSIIYILFYASQVYGTMTIWHGESSWGPRYLVPIIPFGILLTAKIYTYLSRKQKVFVVLPLILIGLYVEFLGIIFPYQIKFKELSQEFYVNETKYPVFVYSNLLPRYSPVITLTKDLYKQIKTDFLLTFFPGKYNVRFYDGLDFPFNVGPERWRSVEKEGIILFDNNLQNPVKKITFDLINHPLSETKITANIDIQLNGTSLLKKLDTIKITERKKIEINIDNEFLKERDNELIINVDYKDPTVFYGKKQLLGLITFYINDQIINKERITVPYISPLGPKLTDVSYKNWGGARKPAG